MQQEQKQYSFLKIEFKDTEYGHVLEIAGIKKSTGIQYENYTEPVSAEQLKSLIVGRKGNCEFFKNLSRKAAENLFRPRGENALTWNVFQSLHLLNRWDILFDAIDLGTGQKLISQKPCNRKPKVYFWNIMPGTGYFNYHHARLLHNSEYTWLSSVSGFYLCEPDCVAFFEDFVLVIEAKLKSPFEKCQRKKKGHCKGYISCYLFQHFLYCFTKMGFDPRSDLPDDCDRDNQLYRNLRIGHLFSFFSRKIVPIVMINVLNESSDNFSALRDQCIEFGRKMTDPLIKLDYLDNVIAVTSWQNIHKSMEQKNNGNKDLSNLQKYLARHPDLHKTGP